jgi:hypothetical protein
MATCCSTYTVSYNSYLIVAISYSLSPRSTERSMSSEIYHLLLREFTILFPDQHYHNRMHQPHNQNSIPLSNKAIFFDYVIVNGHRYHASNGVDSGVNAQSLIHVEVQADTDFRRVQCGELLDIIQFSGGPTKDPLWFGRICWFKTWTGPCPRIWDESYVQLAF